MVTQAHRRPVAPACTCGATLSTTPHRQTSGAQHSARCPRDYDERCWRLAAANNDPWHQYDAPDKCGAADYEAPLGPHLLKAVAIAQDIVSARFAIGTLLNSSRHAACSAAAGVTWGAGPSTEAARIIRLASIPRTGAQVGTSSPGLLGKKAPWVGLAALPITLTRPSLPGTDRLL